MAPDEVVTAPGNNSNSNHGSKSKMALMLTAMVTLAYRQASLREAVEISIRKCRGVQVHREAVSFPVVVALT